MTLLNKLINQALVRHIVRMDAAALRDLVLRWYARGDRSRGALLCIHDDRCASGLIAGDQDRLRHTLAAKAGENKHLRILLGDLLSEIGRIDPYHRNPSDSHE